jgi:hypothetical protein
MKPVIPLIAALVIMNSCSYQCTTPGMYADFNGYDSTGLAIVIVRQYERVDPRFSKLLSTRIGGTSVSADVPGTDTVRMGLYQAFTLKPDYDYTAEVPGTGQLFRLRDFSVEQERDNSIQLGERNACSNTISYYLNDQACSGKGTNIAGSAGVTAMHISLSR